MRETRRIARQLRVGEYFVVACGMRHNHRHAVALRVSVKTLVGDIEVFAATVE